MNWSPPEDEGGVEIGQLGDQWGEDEVSERDEPLSALESETHLDNLGDPVRAYLRQISHLALLSREQELAVARRLEDCQNEIKRIILGFGFAAKEHICLAKELLCESSRERFARGLGDDGAGAFVRMSQAECLGAFEQLSTWSRRALEARNQIVEANLRLVVSVAKGYLHRGVPLLDLIQEGNLGLLKALEKFEYQRGFRFCTYATWWIRRGITSYITEQSRTVRLPANRVEIIGRLSRVTRRLGQTLQREPTVEEIAHEMRMTVGHVRSVLRMSQPAISIQCPVGDDESASLGDFMEDETAGCASDDVSFGLLKESLGNALSALPDRERRVLELRFGLGDGCVRTLEEVGKEYDLTHERIRQIETRALQRMRCPSRLRQLQGFLEDHHGG